jgi:hypothetical protein
MNWEAIAAIGQILSAAGVVFTLGYPAVQIRQSNSIAQWETHRSAVMGFNDAMRSIISDPETAQVYHSRLLEFESLNAVDRLRFMFIIHELVLNLKDTLAAYDAKMFDKQTYEAWQAHICSILNTPGGEIWWKENQASYIARVLEVIDNGKLEVPALDAIGPSFWMTGTAIEIKSPNPDRSTWSNKQ